MDLALVLIGGEKTDYPSRDHIAQVTENAACLVHLWKTDKKPHGSNTHIRVACITPKPRIENHCVTRPQSIPLASRVECASHLPTKRAQLLLVIAHLYGTCPNVSIPVIKYNVGSPTPNVPKDTIHDKPGTEHSRHATGDVPKTCNPGPGRGP